MSYLGDGASLDEGRFICGLGGWNEGGRRGNVWRQTVPGKRHADAFVHILGQLIWSRMENWWYKERKKNP